MKYEAKAWKETEGACLRNFNEQAQIDSVNGALALRPQIEKIIDQIWEEGFDGIYFIGIGRYLCFQYAGGSIYAWPFKASSIC